MVNRARIAYLLRELADEIEREDLEEETPKKNPNRTPPRPSRHIDEVTKARLRRNMAAKGYMVGDGNGR